MPHADALAAAPNRGASRTLAIIGAGFCGVAVALQLMARFGRGTAVVLINESGRMARGLAYGTRSPAHVLNVPAGNMSALANDPEHFLRFCRATAPQLPSGAFMPRQLYGDYLESLLQAADAQTSGAALSRVVGRAVSIVPPAASASDQAVIHFDDGRICTADAVVLAFGHFAPRNPLSAHDTALAGEAFVRDPWRADALAQIARTDPVVLVGAGLTAMDVALALNRQHHVGPLVTVSRHGLAPLPHREGTGAPAQAGATALQLAPGLPLRALMAALRRQAALRLRAGGDWRDLMTQLRALTPGLWAGLSDLDQARFLRHLRPYWEVLRHRCAPQAHAEYRQMVDSGRLERLAGRVARVRRAGDGLLEVGIRPRGGGDLVWRRARTLVNCTGPTTDLRLSASPLVQRLLADGLVRADRFGLGLHVDASYRIVGRDGGSVPWLHYVGPLLKAVHWEATAVPELREHAARLADVLGSAR